MRYKRDINKYIKRNMHDFPKIYLESYKARALCVLSQLKKIHKRKSLLEKFVKSAFEKSVEHHF